MTGTDFAHRFAGCLSKDPSRKRVLVGLPDDSRSSYLRGAAAAPEAIRQAYDGRCYNSCSESGEDLAGQVFDAGDWESGATWDETARRYEQATRQVLQSGRTPYFLGGDHAVTIPVLAGFAELGTRIHVVQFDAHPDLYPQLDGDRFSHACVAARALEMSHVGSITQYGIRTMNPVQREVVEGSDGAVLVNPASSCLGELTPPPHWSRGDRFYVTVDLDGLDPSEAPGVSHPVPGGLTFRQVVGLIAKLPGPLVGMDVVELNPSRDPNHQTAVLAGRLLHEGMAHESRTTSGR